MAPTIRTETVSNSQSSSPTSVIIIPGKAPNLPRASARIADLFSTECQQQLHPSQNEISIASQSDKELNLSSNDSHNNDSNSSDSSWTNFAQLKVKEKRNQLLMNICLKTLELSAKNRQLQKELTELREQTRDFLESVKANPKVLNPEEVCTSLASSSVPKVAPSSSSPQTTPAPTLLHPFLLNLSFMNPGLYNPLILKALTTSTSAQSTASATTVKLVSAIQLEPTPVIQRTERRHEASQSTSSSDPDRCRKFSNDSTSSQQSDLICSCCSDDGTDTENGQSYYAQLNGLAQNWVKRLLGVQNPRSSTTKIHSENSRKRALESSFSGVKRFKMTSLDLRSSSPASSESSFISSLGISTPPLFGSSEDADTNGFDSIHIDSAEDLAAMTDQELFQQSLDLQDDNEEENEESS